MTTRREHHNHFSIKKRLGKIISSIVNKLNINPPTSLPTAKLKFEKWKCEPLHTGQMHFITVCDEDVIAGLRGIEIINGKVIDMIKKSEYEYRIKFKNNRVCKLSSYI